MKIGITLFVVTAFTTATALAPVRAEDTLRVAYAGSMGVVMDKALGPAFATSSHVAYQGQGQGAYAMARLLASRKIVADVFVSITPGPMDVLKKAGLIDSAVPVASTSMVIAYNPRGKFADAFKAGAGSNPKQAWWKVLQSPGLKFGRTDPVGDPQGQNIIFTMQLAESYYKQPGLAHAVLGDTMNPQQVYTEGGLLTRLEAGQIDASSGYESAVISAKLPYIALPDEINLSNPAFAKDYSRAGFSIRDADGKNKELHPEPLVFYAATLSNAPNAAAAKGFIDFMNSSAGQALFNQNGYGKPKGSSLYPR
ncbi:MAG: modA [Tardiphaga sp.]|jgi:molybdate/tungstate transport system substrate-binding protein|nr:modA [Tardiphaga sp.]